MAALLLLTACQPPSRATAPSANAPATTSRASADPTVASLGDPAELSFQEQVERVRTAASDTVYLEHSPVTSAEVRELPPLVELRTLILDRGVVTDADVPHLTAHSHLVHLRLRLSPLTDAGLAALAAGGLTELSILNVPQAKPTAAGLRALAVLPNLRQLRIGGRQIDDAAIEELSRWPALASLHLIHPGITAAALETFAKMPDLHSLYVDGARVSEPAWDRLQRQRPQLHLHLDQVHDDLPR